MSIPIIPFQPQNNHVRKVTSSLSAVRRKLQLRNADQFNSGDKSVQ